MLLCPNIVKTFYIKIGTGKNERLLNVTEAPFEESLSISLPGLHAFSGCDSTSAFHGIGKVKWLNLVKSHELYCDALCLLGENSIVQDAIFDTIEQMVCTAYGFENEVNIDDIRYKKCCGKEFPDPIRLPPTKDELKQHIQRSNYQGLVWKNALEIEQDIPDPDGYGWKLVDGCLNVHWMDNEPAPNEILELVVCECRRQKCADEFQCLQLQIPCTDICKCKSECNNQNMTETDDFDETSDEEVSDYDYH